MEKQSPTSSNEDISSIIEPHQLTSCIQLPAREISNVPRIEKPQNLKNSADKDYVISLSRQLPD
jgi:hypothetical protein